MRADCPAPDFDIVIATAGRGSLALLLDALAAAEGPLPQCVVAVDDRRAGDGPLLPERPPGWVGDRLVVVGSGGGGPARARNAGWRCCTGEWVAFLDDDVVPEGGWLRDLAADLAGAAPGTAALQGRLRVPRPAGRR